ncbi:hypothetical protein B2G88_11685 [Natronolimnobius baerhuensis]|uniref:Uncharacterized protein n=1 Tax=Natronolimnobius baerhuensis TaxID=253108 RepID=A0A202EA26_9EURY|nr:hypothetical protein B2G88_11685 [Natronolimnobius baerhuensis]
MLSFDLRMTMLSLALLSMVFQILFPQTHILEQKEVRKSLSMNTTTLTFQLSRQQRANLSESVILRTGQ